MLSDGLLKGLRDIERGDGQVCQRDVNVLLAQAVRELLESRSVSYEPVGTVSAPALED